MDGNRRLEVPLELRRGKRNTEGEWLPAALRLLELLATTIGQADLGATSVLDMGCGTKFTAAIVNHGVPIRRYVGIDTDAEVIEFLAQHVDDPRLDFHHLDVHNDLYNQTGQPLSSFDRLPVGDERFDVISLFSVFTHLAPHDYTAMLRLLRPHVEPDGRLLYSVFIDEGGADPDDPFTAEVQRRLEAGDPEVLAAVAQQEAGGRTVPDFVDRIPEQPLMEAVYSEPYARQLIEGTGWEVIALHRPVRPIIQHHFLCRPV